MKKFLTVNKKKIIFLAVLFGLILTFHFNVFGIKDDIYKTYPNLQIHKAYFNKISIVEKVKNDYNVKFLPDTQFENLNLVKKKFNFNKKYYESNSNVKAGVASPPVGSFFLEFVDSKIWVIDYTATVYELDEQSLIKNNSSNLNGQIIPSNFSTTKILDTYIHDNKIYISYVNSDNCYKINIVFAEINSQKLNFKNFFKTDECAKLVLAGRMYFHKHQEKEGLLLTTHGHPNNIPDDTPQDDKSTYGKILFIDFKNKDSIVFSKGHRNGLGLYADENVILQTSHGPRGGDEVNKIIYNKNYGWPIASYGGVYDFKYGDPITYKNNHSSLGFEEPIFSFVPSIGISEIIKLPNDFSEHFIDNFLIASLNGRSLYRVKFDKDYTKLLFSEKIFHNRRVRDLKYHSKFKLILLTLEETAEIAIISKK
jgi:hypothetical protein